MAGVELLVALLCAAVHTWIPLGSLCGSVEVLKQGWANCLDAGRIAMESFRRDPDCEFTGVINTFCSISYSV